VISIAMATYNGERFLEEQLRTLSEQVKLTDEAVFCDGASTDRTPEILAQFAKRAPFPVRLVINDQRLSWRENFIKAASLCASDYIAFCDQDDVWLPGNLSVVSRYLGSDRCILLQHGYRLIDDDGNFISGGTRYAQADLEVLWGINFVSLQVFHRSLLEFSRLWELSVDRFAGATMEHDNWIAFLGSLFHKTLPIDDELVYYRQHNTNVAGLTHPVSAVSINETYPQRIERLQAAFRDYRQGLYQAQGRRGAREAIADLVYGVAN
jgi:glycosyltransferase involved in cell wall biosynthesis